MADMFLMLEGIDGESQDEAQPVSHAGEIEVTGWAWNMNNPADFKMNQSVASTKLEVANIDVTKICDIATVALSQYCALGKHIPNGKLTCRKNAGDQKVEYLIIELTDIMVKKLDWKETGEPGPVPEVVSLNFAQFKINYTLQDDTGSAVATADFGFNVQTHQPI